MSRIIIKFRDRASLYVGEGGTRVRRPQDAKVFHAHSRRTQERYHGRYPDEYEAIPVLVTVQPSAQPK